MNAIEDPTQKENNLDTSMENTETETEQEQEQPENDSTQAQEPEETFYTPRRLIVTLSIGMPKDAVQRTEFLTDQLNEFLGLARRCSTKHLRVIKYSENRQIVSKDKKSWLKKFRGVTSDHLTTYVHGYYPWQQLRDGASRFKLYLAIPLKHQDIHTYIRVLNEAWGDPQRATVIDVQGQEIYAPKKIGWLFRSHRIDKSWSLHLVLYKI